MEANAGNADGLLLEDEVQVPSWHDRKRYLWLFGVIVPTIPLFAWWLVADTGFGIFWWLGPMMVYLVIPFFDYVIGDDAENPPDTAVAWLENDRYYRWCTYLFLPVHFASLVMASWQWTRGDLAVVDKIGLAVTIGLVSGVGINTAHELGHKRDSLERWLSKIALAPAMYGHFFIEHNRGHHVRVATPEDPASARLGESFWEFLPRSVVGSLVSAWEIEKKRMDRLGKSAFSIRNDVINAWLMTVVLFGGLVVVFGVAVLPWLIIQGCIGFSLLEVVNYLEHYGLAREKQPDGRYERCLPGHSWNSNNISSNVFLYHLQRHSDHHSYPTRRYQSLRHFDEAPNLPSGYATMIVIAYLAPLWSRIMDKRVLSHYGGDVSRANIHPRRREKILARYQPPAQSV